MHFDDSANQIFGRKRNKNASANKPSILTLMLSYISSKPVLLPGAGVLIYVLSSKARSRTPTSATL